MPMAKVRGAGLIGEADELGLDLAVARGDLLLVELEQFQALAELEQMVLAPGAFQGARDGLRIRLAVGIAQRRQRAGLALPVQDRPEDDQARPAEDVTDDAGELEIHQLKGFLHVLAVALLRTVTGRIQDFMLR